MNQINKKIVLSFLAQITYKIQVNIHKGQNPNDIYNKNKRLINQFNDSEFKVHSLALRFPKRYSLQRSSNSTHSLSLSLFSYVTFKFCQLFLLSKNNTFNGHTISNHCCVTNPTKHLLVHEKKALLILSITKIRDGF